jgi:hypothetical protein
MKQEPVLGWLRFSNLINYTMKTTERARISFNYACKQASRCRHGRYQVSCDSCPMEKTCDIQKRIEKARVKME